jgi:hypothetical protein
MNLLQELIRFRKEFWDVKRLQQKGLRYWSPRPMDEAALCDRIALIQKGLF